MTDISLTANFHVQSHHVKRSAFPPPPQTDTLTYRSEHDLLIGAANGVLLDRVD